MKEQFGIAQIIASVLCGNASEEELEILKEWLELSPENHALYNRIAKKENIRHAGELLYKFDKQKAWDKINPKLSTPENIIKPNRSFWNRIGKYAAILIIGIAVSLLFNLKKQPLPQPGMNIPVANHRIPVPNKGILLKLADGKVINLKETSGEIKTSDNQIVAANDNGILSYQNTADKDSLPIYNEIYVSRGEIYQLELSDGSIVILNSMSRIKYPVHFRNTSREIELEGEAYLMVKHDNSNPFTVKTKDFNILVLGTKFNVSAYANESKVTTTLVEGSVQVESQQHSIQTKLKPNEQLLFNKQTLHQSVEKVDVTNSISWIEGKLRFRDIPLEELMIILQRWYDVEIEYENSKVRNLIFGCNFNRLDSIDQMIEVFEQTGKVKFLRNGKQLKIYIPN